MQTNSYTCICREHNFSLLEHLPIGICVVNQDSTIEFFNNQLLVITGKSSPQQLMEIASLAPWIKKGFAGETFTTDIDFKDKSICIRLRGIPIRDAQSEMTMRLLILAEDVTREKRLEADMQNYIAKLRQEQSRFMASINSLSIGFIIIDVKNNILIKNDAIDHILNLKNMEGNVMLRGDAVEIENRFKGSFDFDVQCQFCLSRQTNIEFKDVQFEGKFLHVFLSPVTTAAPAETIGVVVLIEDITEAKILERSKDEFFSIASHELRTPLTAIRGNTSMILDYFADQLKDPQLRDMIKDIHSSSIRLIKIVNDFLNMSRVEQGKMEFKKEAVDVVLLTNEVCKELHISASDKNLSLEAPNPTLLLPRVLADKDKLKEALINLIGNSIKFTEKGGVTISIQKADSIIKILVSDTGRGIPLSNQSLLFRKFQQAGSSLFTRDSSKGTGLGLYISKLMIEGMGGAIEFVSSEENKGSTFAFTLPIVST